MPLLLTERDIKALIAATPDAGKQIVDLVARAFADLARGYMTVHPRVHVSYPPYQAGDGYASYNRAMRFLPAILPGFSAAGFRFYSTFSPDGKGWREQTEWIALLNYQDMSLQALLSDHYIHEFRTSALKRRRCALGLFGSGRQARGLLRTLCGELQPQRIIVYSPNSEHRRCFAQEMSAELGIQVIPATAPEQVARDVDVVACATKTETPVLDGGWLLPGAPVISLARHELDAKTVLRADRLITGSVEQTLHDTPPRQPFSGLVESGPWPRSASSRWRPWSRDNGLSAHATMN